MFAISMLTAIMCVAADTMAGILVGGLISLLIFTEQMSQGHAEIHVSQQTNLVAEINAAEIDDDLQHFTINEIIVQKKQRNGVSSHQNLDQLERVCNSVGIDNKEAHQELQGDTIVYRIAGQLT
jgi:hypothetical protein